MAAFGGAAWCRMRSAFVVGGALLSMLLATPSCWDAERSQSAEMKGQAGSAVAAPAPSRSETQESSQAAAPAAAEPSTAAEAQKASVLPKAQLSQAAEPGSGAASLAKLAAVVSKMKPGEWTELPDTRIPLVTPEEHDRIVARFGGAPFWGWSGSGSVITAWNTSAYDPEGHQWYFFGGGHSDYGGNEVYAFDFRRLAWSRLTSPSPLTGPSYVEAERSCPTPASGPPSVHTYDGFVWNPDTRSVWLLALDGPFCTQDDGSAPRAFWEFIPETKEWRSYEAEQMLFYPAVSWNPFKRRFVVLRTQGAGSRMEVDGKGEVHNYDERASGWLRDATGVYDPKRKVTYVLQEEQILTLTDGLGDGRLFDLPLDLQSRTQSGFVYHAPSDRFVIWSGERAVFTWDPKDNTFERYDNLGAGRAPKGGAERAVYGKIVYLAPLDLFAAYNNPRQGVWLYRLPREAGKPVRDQPRACVNDDCRFNSIRRALAEAGDGAVVKILPGNYQEAGTLEANGVTILAKGVHLHDAAAQGKAALVIQGSDTVIEDLECSNVTVSSGNGACIRLEGRNLTLRRVHFHGNQMGMLTSSDTGLVRIEDSLFEDNGIPGGSLGHNLYIQGDELEFVRSKSLRARNEGHELKSRARRTVIEDSVLASLDAEDSRVIDLPNGGENSIRNSIIQQGPNTSNWDVIAVGLERGRDQGTDHAENELVIEGNTILLDRDSPLQLLHLKDVAAVVLRDNTVVGGGPLEQDGNTWFPDRAAAGLPAYPELPERP